MIPFIITAWQCNKCMLSPKITLNNLADTESQSPMSWNDELALQLGKPELSAPLEAVLNSNLQNNQVKAFVKRAIDQKLQTMFGYASFVSNPDLKVFKAALHRREFYNDQSLVYYLPYDRDFHSLANILQSRKAEISPFHNIIVTPISLSKNSETIDIDQLEYQIKIDIFKDRVPVFVLGRYGSPITGEIDDLKSLQMICSRNLMWLHVKGCCLSLNSVKCDSFEVDIGLVYNLKTPKIVFFKTIDWSLLSPKTSLLVDPVSVVEVDAKDNWSAQSTETDRLEITLPLYKFLFDHGDQSAMRVYHCAQLIETLYGFIKGNRFLSTVPSVTLLTFLVRYNGVFKSEDVKVGNDLFDKVCLELKRKQASEMNETNRVYNIATKHV